MKKQFFKKVSALFLSLCMILGTFLSVRSSANFSDIEIERSSKSFSGIYNITFKSKTMLEKIKEVYLDSKKLSEYKGSTISIPMDNYNKAINGDSVIKLNADLKKGSKVIFVTEKGKTEFTVKNPSNSFNIFEKESKFSSDSVVEEPKEKEERKEKVENSIKSLKYISDSSDFKFTIDPISEISKINKVFIDGKECENVSSKYTVWGKDFSFYVDKDKNEIYLGKLNDKSVLTLKNNDVVLGSFKFDKAKKAFISTSEENVGTTEKPIDEKNKEDKKENEIPKTEDSSVIKSVTGKYDFQDYAIVIEPKELLSKVNGVEVGTAKYSASGLKISTFGKKFFVGNDMIYLGEKPRDNSVIVLKNGETILGKFKKISDTEYKKIEDKTLNDKQLHVRLVGSFESALSNQKKYDAITTSTSSSSSIKNSNVVVQVAETEKGKQPIESDWKLVKDSKEISLQKSKVVINDETMGMKAVYHVSDSSVTLSGVPTKVGKYKIYIDAVDDFGRTAKSNELDFNVYDLGKVKLVDQLKDANFKALNHGEKKEWDMEPWYIELFASDKKEDVSEVVVPSSLKIWHGSHQSGTYGVLGYAVEQDKIPNQTLIVENGTTLTIRNMKIFSSVNILVRNGGKLNFYDSSLYGRITVENNGILQMNYDEFNKKYLTGSSINGQIILKNGAILEDSIIYSNANNLTDSNKARLIETPVIRVEGDITVKGKVYVRGDEAPTGKFKSENGNDFTSNSNIVTGQPAMEVVNGATVNITANSELGLYGGGKNVITTNGGDALILKDNSSVKGEGKLIAVGGDGQYSGKGGNGVFGNGSIETKEAFLQGGDNHTLKNNVGKAYTDGINISEETIGYAKDGKHSPSQIDKDKSPYWRGYFAPGIDKTIVNPLENSSTEGAPTIIPQKEKFTVKYKFENNDLPDDILKLLPKEYKITKNSKIDIPEKLKDVATENGTWSFSGWITKSNLDNIIENIEFTGSWTFTKKQEPKVDDKKDDEIKEEPKEKLKDKIDDSNEKQTENKTDNKLNNLSSTDEEIKFIFGDSQKISLGENLSPIKISPDIETFRAVLFDGKVLDKDLYTITKGSTIISFKEEFSKLLTLGNHSIEFDFTIGKIETKVVVEDKTQENNKLDKIDKEKNKDINLKDSKTKKNKLPKTGISKMTLSTIIFSVLIVLYTFKKRVND